MRIIQLSVILVLALFGYNLFIDRHFEQWNQGIREQALQQGISEQTLNLALRGLFLDSRVLRLDANQPEFSRPIWDYLDKAVSEKRIQRGQELLVEYRPLLDKVVQRYHVPEEFLLAIWGMETDYGGFKGSYSIIRSLASLAYHGREERRSFWRTQLFSALRILDDGDIALADLNGSWAGAFGHTQFMPLTFLEYAVDFDGDGKRDVVNSVADALASTANYLAKSGWRPNEPWAVEVKLPANFEWSESDPNYWQSVQSWLAQGVTLLTPTMLNGDESGFILLPAGHRGPTFLALRNFNVLMKYNNAMSYALAVGTLGGCIRGGKTIQAAWPRDDEVLSRSDRAELQELLSAAGYSTDGIDGFIGPNTRAALRRWQADVGYPADGYPTLEHLLKLRSQVTPDAGQHVVLEHF